MPAYKHIIFDLDHTLWDFEANCRETLFELYEKYELDKVGINDKEKFAEHYRQVNDDMWKLYHHGKISKDEIRTERFVHTFKAFQVSEEYIPEGLDQLFIQICPTKANVFPHTHEVLSYLKNKNYQLHILTNGFPETQHIKISTSGLEPYFSELINCERDCGFLKPKPEAFDHALKRINCTTNECVMIGDDLFADILGAKNAGIDHIYFNPKRKPHDEKVTHEIFCLSDLMAIL